MIYIFDKTQAIIKVLTNDDFTAAHLNFKINTATTFEFSLPASKALPSDSKFVATPHPLNNSKFIMLRLTERVDNTETIDYSAYELAYQELATDGYIEDKRPQNQSALNLMKIALDGSNWELNNVNVSGTATTNFYYVDHLSAISNVVDLLGGEIVFYIEIQGNAISGRYMDYLARQGADTSKVFASGSNLLTVERQSDTSGIYTAILPRGKGKEIDNGEADTPDGYGRRINISDVEWKKSSGKPLDKPKGSIVLSDPDATAEWGQINGNARLLLQTYDDIDDVNVLINSAYKTLQSVNHPQIQYSATVADVGGLSLGDTVLIMHGDRDLSYKTRVFEVKYDLLAPDQTELSLGDDLSSNSITSQINSFNAVADTTSSQTQWTINQIGRPGTTYGETAPDSPKVGDIWFKYLPDGGTEIYRWNGDIWELLASPTTADDIAAAVDDAVTQAKSHTAAAIEQNNASQQEVMNDIAKSQANLAIKDGDFNNKAQAMADKALSDAKANAANVAQETLNSANANIADARKSLSDSIASEASARTQAVAAANSQAQTYANQAKADAMSAASSADGVIRTAISSSANSMSATIKQNKSSADSGISTAQTTAQAAVDGLAFKVSKTDYDQKTGDLSTKINDVKQTADSSAQTIADIKTADGKQDARMSEIENTASGLKSTVSDLSTAQGKQSGYISTLQQRADGFEGSIREINDTVNSLGQINQLFNTEFSPDFAGWNIGTPTTSGKFTATPPLSSDISWSLSSEKFGGSNVLLRTYGSGTSSINSGLIPIGGNVLSTVAIEAYSSSNYNGTVTASLIFYYYDSNQNYISNTNKDIYKVSSWTRLIASATSPSNAAYVVVAFATNGSVGTSSYSQPMMVFSSTVGAYVQGNYNNNSATAKAQLTADQATLSINNYKTDADGRITKAQSDITQTAKDVTTKVSQTDYDKKTGDLTTAVNTAQSTANSAVTTIGNYQTSNDGRVSAAESNIEQNSKDITARVTQTDYDNNNSNLNTRFTKVEATADGASTTVGKLQTAVNNLGQVNQLFNTEFSPDLQGWSSSSLSNYLDYIDIKGVYNLSHVLHYNGGTASRLDIQSQKIKIENPAQKFSISVLVKGKVGISVVGYKSDSDVSFSSWYTATSSNSNYSDWTLLTFNNKSIISGSDTAISSTTSIALNMTSTGNEFWLSEPMLVFSSTVGTYVQGNYNNNAALAQVKITADGVSSIVSNPTTGLSTRVQTAEGTLSKVTGTDIPNLQKATYWQPYSSLDFNSYTKQGSFFFNTTSAKTNGPVSGNYSWIYLMVEQGVSDNSRIKQTAWYDGINDIKITYVRTLNSGTWSPWYANDNDSVTTISQTNESIRSEISNRQTGDTNTLTQAKNYTTSQISSSEEGMKSLIAQKADSVIIKTMSNSIDDLKSVTNWQQISYDDLNFLKQTGNYLITQSNNTNFPPGVTAWAYVKVEAPRSDRVTQRLWKDLNATQSYVRTFDGTNWSVWSQQVTSSTLLGIFKDSWSLGMSVNRDIGAQITSGIVANSDSMSLISKNIVLDGNTTVTGDFYAKGGNFKNLNASNLTVGTLNGNQVNITNINANNIVSGVLNSITANSMTLNAGTINGAAIYVTSAQAQMDGTTQNIRLGINPNWQHQLHIEPVNQSSGWYHYLYAGNDHLFLGAWDGSNYNTYDNKVALFTSGGTSEVDVGVVRISSNGSAIYDNGWGSIDGVTGISMKGSDPKYTSMYIGVGNSLNGSPQGELRVVTNATIGTSNLAYADARAAHWYTSSLAKYKTNISELEDGSALAMINRAGIYKYQFKTDVEADNDKYTFGPVIGDNYLNNPVEFLDSTQEGTDDHSASWITMKALQEEDSKVEALIARIEELEEKLESVGK